MIKYGISKEGGQVVYINDAVRGLACNCKCIECARDLIANQGDINEWYFDHYIKTNCKGGIESAMHKLAKQLILKRSKILTPGGFFEYSQVEVEKKLELVYPNFLYPDIAISSGKEIIYVEIYFRNKKKKKQKTLYTDHKLKSFEIDLSKVPYDITPDQFQYLLFEEPQNRELLYWEFPKEKEAYYPAIEQQSWICRVFDFIKSNPFFVLIGLFVGVFFIYKLLFSRKRSLI